MQRRPPLSSPVVEEGPSDGFGVCPPVLCWNGVNRAGMKISSWVGEGDTVFRASMGLQPRAPAGLQRSMCEEQGGGAIRRLGPAPPSIPAKRLGAWGMRLCSEVERKKERVSGGSEKPAGSPGWFRPAVGVSGLNRLGNQRLFFRTPAGALPSRPAGAAWRGLDL